MYKKKKKIIRKIENKTNCFPSPRINHAIAKNDDLEQMYLHGGSNQNDGILADFWTYNFRKFKNNLESKKWRKSKLSK